MKRPLPLHTTLAAGAAVTILAGALHWFAGSEGHLTRNTSNQHQAAAFARSDILGAHPKRQNEAPQAQPVELPDTSPFVEQARATSAQQLEAQLIERARSGDTASIAVMLDLISRCAPFYPAPDTTYHPRQEIDKLATGSPDRQAREFALALQESFCDRPYAPGETAELRAGFRAMLDAAVASGDTVARATNGFSGESEVQLIEALRGTNDPWIAERALAAFSLSEGPAARRIDAEVFPSDLLLPAGRQQRLLIKQMAARWHACSMGAPCGHNQHHELSQCVYLGNCGIGLSVQAFIRQRELSSRQFELMQRYLAAIREAGNDN